MSTLRLSIMIGLWGAVIGPWLIFLAWYANAPGLVATPPQAWPAESRIHRDGTRPTLLMFIHPKCPCSQSSLEELARILARCKNTVSVFATFVRPPDVAQAWEMDRNWRTAAAIPHVRMVVDEGGREARLFGATTSGQVHLYDADGVLQFSGGVTGARNHAGDNAGAQAVEDWLRGGHSERRDTFVFGCPLLSGAAERRLGDAECHP